MTLFSLACSDKKELLEQRVAPSMLTVVGMAAENIQRLCFSFFAVASIRIHAVRRAGFASKDLSSRQTVSGTRRWCSERDQNFLNLEPHVLGQLRRAIGEELAHVSGLAGRQLEKR